MSSDEVNFLREQVQRLNAVLSQYQDRYLPVHGGSGEGGLFAPDDPPAQWLTDRSLLSPLLAEYDHVMQTQKDQLQQCRADQARLKDRVEQLVTENNRLQQELHQNVQSQLELARVQAGGSFAPEEGDPLNNLQEQLQLANQEKDHAMDLWRSAQRELDRVQQEKKEQLQDFQLKTGQHQASSAQLRILNQKCQQLQLANQRLEQATQQYIATINGQNTEMDRLREELKKAKHEAHTSAIQLTETRKTLEDLHNQLKGREQENSEALGREEAAGSRLKEVQTVAMDLEMKIADAIREIDGLQKEKKKLEDRVSSLLSKNSDLEEREFEVTEKVRDSVQMVENALLERDQAIVREKQNAQEIQRLQAMLAKLLNEAGARTRKEVDSVREQCNKNLEKLMEEIHGLEMEVGQKQAQVDRAIREKRAVEGELEKVYKSGEGEGGHASELTNRLFNAERARDEADMNLRSLQKKLKKMEDDRDQNRQQHEAILSQTTSRVDSLRQDCEDLTMDKIQLQEEISKLRQEANNGRRQGEEAQRKAARQVAMLEQEHKQREREFLVKLEGTEDANRHSMSELRKLLTAQQKMNAKWREESKSLTRKFEGKLSELRSELSRHKKYNDELRDLLESSQQKNAELERRLGEYKEQNNRLQQRLRDAENRVTKLLEQPQGGARDAGSLKSRSRGFDPSLLLSDLKTSTYLE
ncbi:PREDICTED: sodium channel and clathrin linker 1-like isoform X1 [Branchiostoma belcheri]|uniref:Sodium channel and clathrin linker 1-like isoform X1 n=1 Tax=Branchiostoma belcheri TaxID=7741 RepID=A0A6P4YWJ1_BRABE|nr:PREDICTED: sodium channel and clathrin linker 1-like isoform X1 [Branchiostoma belcheri]